MFLRARLSPESYLGLHLTIGLVIVLMAGWWFADVAEDMSRNVGTRALDEQVANYFHAHATPLGVQLARVGSFFGSVGFVTGATMLALGWCVWRQWFYRGLAIAITMGGGSLLNIFLKHLFHRQRPVLENPYVTLSSYGFPSGHTMGSTMVYGVLALLAAQAMRHRARSLGPLIAAATAVATIGFTRIYLGAHFLTDVLGAIAAGLSWLTIAWTGVETWRRWRESLSAAGNS